MGAQGVELLCFCCFQGADTGAQCPDIRTGVVYRTLGRAAGVRDFGDGLVGRPERRGEGLTVGGAAREPGLDALELGVQRFEAGAGVGDVRRPGGAGAENSEQQGAEAMAVQLAIRSAVFCGIVPATRLRPVISAG